MAETDCRPLGDGWRGGHSRSDDELLLEVDVELLFEVQADGPLELS
jgi:hypothetical protein